MSAASLAPSAGATGPASEASIPPALHVDADLVVFDKPSGLLAVPGRGEDKQDCLWRRAQQRWPELLVVHRLDMGTSGLIAFARGAAAQRFCSMAFEQRRVGKRYLAVVDGLVAEDEGQIELPVGRDWERRPLQRVDLGQGKPSLTRWQVLARDPLRRRTRLLLFPHTGRSHQLRVHLQAIGHPILGDELYADAAAAAAAPRLLLHACELVLPRRGQASMLVLRSEAPF